MGFVPDDVKADDVHVPWFEDASSELGVKGHRTNKTIDDLKIEIRAAMSALGGGVTSFRTGHWPGEDTRYGYEIRFKYGQREGRIQIAGFPMKRETDGKREQCLKQALFTVRDSLQAQLNARWLMPGNAPLVGFMLDDKGRTLAEALAEQSAIPLLAPPMEKEEPPKGKHGKQSDGEVVEGSFREEEP